MVSGVPLNCGLMIWRLGVDSLQSARAPKVAKGERPLRLAHNPHHQSEK